MHVNVVIATISGSIIGNIGNVPLVLIAALCRDKSNPFGDYEICSRDGNAYISFGQWVGAIVLYTYVFHMLAPPPEGTFDIKDFFKFLYEKLKLKQIIQPAIIASIIAIIIGFVPMLRRLVFTSDAPLYFFTDSCFILGKCKAWSKDNCRVPPTGLGIVTLADKFGFLPPGDEMFRFVLLLQHTMPTSVLSGAVANLRGCGKEAASILFWVHIFVVFSMAGWITLYLNILF
ncbi:hypothetical protein K7X08_000155 [Anisodus acutangulus]|uniref:Uncharacterized protein n=1 Tax=Anisodus acutangulus TaxID=402998 RepID=A0A9Q1M2Y7_9SOLA|nr:hypothetical protein K7X08_000155 [Anisodus acutangulus]